MRATRIVRLSSDPFKTHVHDRSPAWKKVREALVVNSDSSSGNPLPSEHRWPQPASRPEHFSVPASKASDVAQNPYYQRDFRRMYPKTEVVTQGELATLLIAQGGFTSLPSPNAAEVGTKALTKGGEAPSLAKVYLEGSPASGFKPPTPPGSKYKWTAASEVIPSAPDAYFPMYNASAERIA